MVITLTTCQIKICLVELTYTSSLKVLLYYKTLTTLNRSFKNSRHTNFSHYVIDAKYEKQSFSKLKKLIMLNLNIIQLIEAYKLEKKVKIKIPVE